MDLADRTSIEHRFIRELVQILEPHLDDKDFNVTRMCALVGMSRVSVHRRLKAILNQPAGEFIRTQRLKRAARLLKNGEVNVCQAARLSGFYNLSYFSKCFKAYSGSSPSKFKNTIP